MLTVALPAAAQNQKERDAKVEQELRKLVLEWDTALVKNDVATLDRLLGEEFSFVGGANKAQYLASFKSGSTDSVVESAVSTDIQIQVYGSTAVLTGLDTIKGKNKGQPYVARWLYLDVWVLRDGRWQCVKTYASQAKS
jgi:ketosteroid isomerase-like protein